MSRRVRLVVLVLAAVAIAIAVPWFLRRMEIDRCLDRGGCWDSSRAACDYQHQANCKR